MATEPETQEQQPNPWAARIGSHPGIYTFLTIMALAAAFLFLAIAPAVRALQAGGGASVADARARLEVAQEVFGSQAALVDGAVSISAENRERLGYLVPAEADVPGMVAQIGAISRSAGVTLQGIDLTSPTVELPPEYPANFRVLDIALNLGSASYERLKLFVAAIESNLRLIDVRSFTIAPLSGAANMELRAYYAVPAAL